MMSDVPYGVLLSGGLILLLFLLLLQNMQKRIESGDEQEAWYPRLHSFCSRFRRFTGFSGCTKAAEHIGSVHHEIHFYRSRRFRRGKRCNLSPRNVMLM